MILAALVTLAVQVSLAPSAAAHGRSMGRSIVTLDDDGGGAEIRLTVSLLDRDALFAQLGGPERLAPALTGGLYLSGPAGPCRASAPAALPAPTGQAAFRWRVRCPSPPDRLVCDLLVAVIPGHVHLSRLVQHGRGTVVAFGADRRVANLDRPPIAPGWSGFVGMGLDHVTSGVDHLLFLLTLLLVAGTLRELALAATGFTVGHTVALLLAVAIGARPSAAGIEVLVAASIAVVAAEGAAARAGRTGRRVPLGVAGGLVAVAGLAAASGSQVSLALLGLALLAGCYLSWIGRAPDGRVRIMVTGLFGLIHGFAFAGPLADLDLHGGALATALISFNLGIELAQLGLLAAGWLALGALRRRLPGATGFAVDAAAAAAVAPAVYWMIIRSV